MTRKEHQRAAAALALATARAGGTNALAEALGITPAAVSKWEVAPPARVLAIEAITKIARHELRPDFYPEPTDA